MSNPNDTETDPAILRGDKPQGFYDTRRHARDFAYGKRVVRARRIVVWKGGES